MNKKVPVGLTVSLMIITAALTVCITMLVSQQVFSGTLSGLSQQRALFDKLYEIDEKIQQYYYGEVDKESLYDGAAQGYISGLGDPYADYSGVEDSELDAAENEGQQIGIGVTVVQHPDNGTIYVARVDAQGPANQAGIRPGDEIIRVDGQAVAEIGYSQAVELLLGDAGSLVTVVVKTTDETGAAVEVPYSIERTEFTHTSVYAHMIGTVGYIQITTFDEATTEQFKTAVQSMIDQGATGLIFDVRNNGGGLVDATAAMLDYLLPEGDIISATYADGTTEVLYTSDASEIDLPMAVLTNGYTASAAELFAAAIRDYDKGVLIGSQTYGKGVMQRTYPLSDGSSVKFTIAAFNPPSGENFNDVGLAPDLAVDLTEEQQKYYYMLSDTEDPVIAAAANWVQTGTLSRPDTGGEPESVPQTGEDVSGAPAGSTSSLQSGGAAVSSQTESGASSEEAGSALSSQDASSDS